MLTHEWDGRIRPQDVEEIELPIDFADFYAGVSPGDATFYAEIQAIEGGEHDDEQDDNNRFSSTFEMPPMYDDEEYEVYLRTNNAAGENALQIRDADNELVLNKLFLVNNRIYRDTLQLAPGCYTMQITDSGDNGLDFWAIPAQGNGALRLSSLSRTLQVIEPDFGSESTYAWMVGSVSNVSDASEVSTSRVYPNPTDGLVTITWDKPLDTRSTLIVSDMLGKTLQTQVVGQGELSTVADLSTQSPGIYNVMLITNDRIVAMSKVVRL